MKTLYKRSLVGLDQHMQISKKEIHGLRDVLYIMPRLPRKFNKELQKLVNIAYGREANSRLGEFSKSIDEGRKWLLGSGELSSLIHEFDRGQSRALTSMHDRLDPSL